MADAPGGAPAYVVVTPWYPTAQRPHHGVFVRDWTRAIGRPALVLHLDAVEPGAASTVEESATPEGRVVRIPVPVAPATSRALTARAHAAALRAHLTAHPGLVGEDAVVHAHVGMPSGYAAAVAVPVGARFVLTEHASYLPTILARDDARALYAVAAARADAVLMVGEEQARLLRTAVPAVADRVVAVGNPIDAGRFTPRARPRGPLTRWVTVGNLVPGKGAEHVVAALAAAPDARLTVVGDGAGRSALEDAVRAAGVQDRVELRGALAPDEVPAVLAAHDVAVQLSDRETFGLAPLEAVLSGLPVVATACGGPQTTLADAAVHDAARLVPVRPTPAQVVGAVAELVVPSDDPGTADADAAAVRDRIVARYGAEAFGARVRRVLDGTPLDPPVAGRPGVLTVALGPAASAGLAPRHDAALRSGATVLHLTAAPSAALACDARLEAGALLETAWGASAPPTVREPTLARWARGAARTLPGAAGRAAGKVGRALAGQAADGAAAGELALVADRCSVTLAAPDALAARLVPQLPDVALVVPVEDAADDATAGAATRALAAAIARATGARLVGTDALDA